MPTASAGSTSKTGLSPTYTDGADVVEQRVVREVGELCVHAIDQAVAVRNADLAQEDFVHLVPEPARLVRRRRPELVRLGGRAETIRDDVDPLADRVGRHVVSLTREDAREQIREGRMRMHEGL